jgi:Domain of unknown function (DUF5615)
VFVSIRYQADNDLNQLIVAATFRKQPSIDFQSARKAHLNGLDDMAVLHQAASEGRILVSHDKRTMPRHLASFLKQGGSSPGVLLVIPQDAPLRAVVETLVLIWTDNTSEDWQNAITVIPF